MPRPVRGWTSQEEDLACALFASGSSRVEIGKRLHRSEQSVGHKLQRLNAGSTPKHRHFTAVDKRRLRQLYPTASWLEIERAFPGRRRDTISQAAQRLGLTRPRSYEARDEIEAVNQLPETTIAYMAGIVDGEGSIIRRANGQPVLSIGSTSEPLIKWLHAYFGGRSYLYANGTGLGRLPFWRWHLSRSRIVEAVIARMKPYLLIKG
jgi:hypothetical protein